MFSYQYVKNVFDYIKASKMSREEVLAIQEARWRSLVRFASQKSPYYSRIMKERGLLPETAKPADFPVLTKQIIQDHFDEIVTDPAIKQKDVHEYVEKGDPETLYLGRYHVLKTSGSSGQPGYFVSSSNEVIAGVSPSVARGHVGRRRFKKRIAMIGFPKSFAGSSQIMNFCNRIWLARQIVTYRPISIEQPFENVLQELSDFQPHILSGYAKLLLLVADAQRSGKIKISPDSVDSGGEQLLETDRRYLKETFGCAVNNHYGSTEGFSMGICRDGEPSIELFEDHLVFAINEFDTHITNLHGFTMPLIRYQMRDVLIPRGLGQAKPFQRVECHIGRSDEIPYFITEENNRVTVHPLAFDPLMPEGVKSFFMVSEKANRVAFHILIDEKHLSRKPQILSKVQISLEEFFKQKGLPSLVIEVVDEQDYHVNASSGKTTFWRNQVLK
jgi:phenylacetate-coenzyme A ligase PaaK-like adenylate-forming protein